ncbi:hypothetical protein K440DRAFT_22942 [Wilcoxina mikolae CBS 423.85]|nr:hypothetical protein K440DRAFT_22942 [Wilcoxina mikolae CBS 423.85]
MCFSTARPESLLPKPVICLWNSGPAGEFARYRRRNFEKKRPTRAPHPRSSSHAGEGVPAPASRRVVAALECETLICQRRRVTAVRRLLAHECGLRKRNKGRRNELLKKGSRVRVRGDWTLSRPVPLRLPIECGVCRDICCRKLSAFSLTQVNQVH